MRRFSLFPVLLLLAACASSTVPKVGAALHAVHDGHLRELMAQMNTLILSEKEMTEPQKDILRRGYDLKMAESAAQLQHTAHSIPDRLAALKLGPIEQNTFLALADKLRTEAQGLRELAEANRSDAIPATLDRMLITCQSCHQLFRKTGA
ncbi:MAG: hypothetical protein PHE55_20225 [Methylococcaceae bacterium]|nr:hypothetical protein [Methylococcaceae bacterium]